MWAECAQFTVEKFPSVVSLSLESTRWVENWMTMTFGRKKRRKVNNDYEENYWVCEAINPLSPDECGVERRKKVFGVEFCRHRRHFKHSAARKWKTFHQNLAHYAQVESVDSEKNFSFAKKTEPASIEQVFGMIRSLLCWIKKMCMQKSDSMRNELNDDDEKWKVMKLSFSTSRCRRHSVPRAKSLRENLLSHSAPHMSFFLASILHTPALFPSRQCLTFHSTTFAYHNSNNTLYCSIWLQHTSVDDSTSLFNFLQVLDRRRIYLLCSAISEQDNKHFSLPLMKPNMMNSICT